MIACLRFKRVRRLPHCYVAPGLCASAIALGGCAIPATTAPPSPATDSAIRGPMATVSMEPPIQVGDVTAVYVTVTNLRSGPYQENELIVLQAHAVGQSGGRVDRLDVDHAIEKAGGADKLLAALGDRSFENAPLSPAPELSAAGTAAYTATLILLAPFWVPLKAVAVGIDGALSDKQKITNKEFPVGRYYEKVAGIVGGPQKILIGPHFSWKGYLFFPRGSYSTLEITAGKIDVSSGAPETQCYWWGCVNTVAEQIDRGESPTLRHTETIRCPWRQG